MNKSKTSVRRSWLRNGFAGLVAAAFSLSATHSLATVDLAPQPLFVITSADANVLFIIDDSGSMQMEVTPDGLAHQFASGPGDIVAYVYPQANNFSDSEQGEFNCGNNDRICFYGASRIPGFDPTDIWAVTFRSAHNNFSYYNPRVRYRPWLKADGTEMDAADPTEAYHVPNDSDSGWDEARGWRNLTVDNTQTACWKRANNTNNTCLTQERTFYPATYFQYRGGNLDPNLVTSYTRVEIRDTAEATYPGGPNRTDCANPESCTYAEEIQNFANWYSYHRSRILASSAGIGRAFSDFPANLRVGFGSIGTRGHTVDGQSGDTVIDGVRPFQGAGRTAFYNRLYTIPSRVAGTPLITALDGAGQYFERTDRRGPWGSQPGAGLPGERPRDHLACRSSYAILMTDGYYNNFIDNTVSHGNVDGADDLPLHTAGPPFADSWSNTLADTAMHYWARDLRDDLDDLVSPKLRNPATWQHMVTYGVALGVEGSVDPELAFAALDAWAENPENPTMPQGWSGWPNPSGSDEAKLDDLLHAAVNGRGGFFSANDPESFTAGMQEVLRDVADGERGAVAAVATSSTRLEAGSRVYQGLFHSGEWSGELNAFNISTDGELESDADGNLVIAWRATDAMAVSQQVPGRSIFTTSTGNDTIVFGSPSMPGALSADQVDWLRGREVEGLRSRSNWGGVGHTLGPIVNSQPVLHRGVIYVGANDGMLHAFNEADGSHRFSYVPYGVYDTLPNLTRRDYGSGANRHQYTVDGPLHATRVDNRSYLIGTLGAGGRGLFVLDVTNSGDPQVMFDYTGDLSPDEIGNVLSEPLVGPVGDSDGNASRVLVLGNGYNSEVGEPRLIIVENWNTNNPTFNALAPHNSESADGNGLGGVVVAMMPGDPPPRARTAYAGDYEGNLWRFDLSGGIAANQGDRGRILYNGDPSQPITVTPTLGKHAFFDHADGGEASMLYFGTGSYLTEDDLYLTDPQTQSFYAILDDGTTATGSIGITRANLFEKTLDNRGNWEIGGQNPGARWWRGGPDDEYDLDEGPNHPGWYMDLPLDGERVIQRAQLTFDRVLFFSFQPNEDPCALGGTSWHMELVGVGDLFDDDFSVLEDPGEAIDGMASTSDFMWSVDEDGNVERITIRQTSDSDIDSMSVGVPETSLGRQSWRQLR